jgi:tetratricopeptide (TPR) repeat protein
MTLARHARAVVAIVVVGLWVAGTWASDDDSDPLFVIHNGQRIPTVIIPPKAAATHAVLEVVESDPPADARAEDGEDLDKLDQPAEPGGDNQPARRHPRRQVLGRYAGYPVSYFQPGYMDWGYNPYYPPGYGHSIREVYEAQHWAREQERQYRFNARDMRQRKQRVLVSHEKALRTGLEHLKRGDYAQAVIALQMAAELNQGDPACRVHLAQARVAMGHYDEAGQVLRRALQLQSKLVYVSLNLGSYYNDPAEFDAHVDKLAAWVNDHRASADAYFLLGYMEFQRDRLEPAYAAFRAAAAARPKDEFTATYLKITRPARR